MSLTPLAGAATRLSGGDNRYASFPVLKHIVRAYVPRAADVLHVGCGNRRVPAGSRLAARPSGLGSSESVRQRTVLEC